MRISDWSSDVCSSDLAPPPPSVEDTAGPHRIRLRSLRPRPSLHREELRALRAEAHHPERSSLDAAHAGGPGGHSRKGDSADGGLLGEQSLDSGDRDMPFHRIAADQDRMAALEFGRNAGARLRSEEHTSELQSLMRISYAVFCLKKKKTQKTQK